MNTYYIGIEAELRPEEFSKIFQIPEPPKMNQTQDPTQMEHDHPATIAVPTVPMNLATIGPSNVTTTTTMDDNARPGDCIITAYHEILATHEFQKNIHGMIFWTPTQTSLKPTIH